MGRFIKNAKRYICVSLVGAFVLGTTAQAADINAMPESVRETQDTSESKVDVSTPADASYEDRELLPGELADDYTEASIEVVEFTEKSTEALEELTESEIEADGSGTSMNDAKEIKFSSDIAVISTAGKGYYYKFTPTENCQYYIYSNCEYNSRCYLYDSAKTEIAYCTDGWTGNNFLLSYPVEKGKTYYVKIKFNSATRTGNIPLSFGQVPLGSSDGWRYGLNHWLYVKNGAIIRNAWAKINNNWYYFNNAGFMATADYRYQIGDEIYGFDNEGRMLKGWVKGFDGWYYYRNNGTAPDGITVIGNDTYLFDNGYMQANVWLTSEDNYIYHFGDNGKLQSKVLAKTNGWNSYEGKWSYYENSKPVTSDWRKIGGKWYYFDANAAMITGLLEYTDPKTNVVSTYAFDKDGCMVTGWYNYCGSWYYFDKNGKQLKGLQTIGMNVYYFDSKGRMVINSEIVVDGVHYYFGPNGKIEEKAAFKEGWNRFCDEWYYQKDGTIYESTLATIGAYTYYFDSRGRMVFNTPVAMYGGAYRSFDKDGHMRYGWYKNGGNWVYFDESGVAVNGMQEIDGATYYFESRNMQTNRVCENGNNAYYFGANGKLQDQLKKGWNEFDGKWYYVDNNGYLVKRTCSVIDGYKYGFNSAGEMVKDQETWFNSSQYPGTYRFDSKGHMVFGWYRNPNGGYNYYLEDGSKQWKGVHEIDGKLYLFDQNGKLRYSCTEMIDDTLYNVDEKGNVTEYYAGIDGWVSYYYYVEHGKIVKGWKKIDGHWYYFDEKGHKLYNDKRTIDGVKYGFDESGHMIIGWGTVRYSIVYADKSGQLMYEGWKQIDGKIFYFENSTVLTGLKWIDDAYQVFDKSGVWLGTVSGTNKFVTCAGKTYYINANGFMAYGAQVIAGYEYYFDGTGAMYKNESYDGKYYCSDGRAAVNKWVEEKMGDWYYYGPDGKKLTNQWFTMDNKTYYFDGSGRMCMGGHEINGCLYNFDINGVWDGKTYRTGWQKINNRWCYFDAGKEINGWLMIDGEWYCFDSNYTIAADIRSFGKHFVYLGVDGKIVKNKWCKMSHDRYEYGYGYADAQGYLVDGLQTINGKKYYFVNNLLVEHDAIDGKYFYEIGSDGVVKNTYTASGTGWEKTASSKWLYSSNGQFVSGYQLIGGKAYMFDEGVMVTNTFYEDYGYFGADGALDIRDDWTRLDDMTDYVSDSAKFVYYAGVYYDISSGTRKQVNLKEGWNEYKGQWYYLQDGDFVTGMTQIGGAWYCFEGETNRMYANTMIFSDYMPYYCGADGKFAKNQWGKSKAGDWYYVGGNGQGVTGINVIDGKTYEFNAYGKYIQ